MNAFLRYLPAMQLPPTNHEEATSAIPRHAGSQPRTWPDPAWKECRKARQPTLRGTPPNLGFAAVQSRFHGDCNWRFQRRLGMEDLGSHVALVLSIFAYKSSSLTSSFTAPPSQLSYLAFTLRRHIICRISALGLSTPSSLFTAHTSSSSLLAISSILIDLSKINGN